MKFSIAKGKTTIIDAEDYDRVAQYRWNFNNGAVCTNIKTDTGRTTLKLHRFLLDLPKGKYIVDHINGNPLDNRKSNLRICTSGQNSFNANKHKDNKSGYKGVSFHKAANKWIAKINYNYQQKYLGVYDTPEEAARAYNKAAKELHKEYARVNIC